MSRYSFISVIIVLIMSFMSTTSFAENNNIEGTVKDAKTGEALFGANIILMGTSMGAASDMHGKYSIQNAVPGTYTIRASYIGYRMFEMEIKVIAGKLLRLDFKLEPVSIESKDVVITAQALGQAQAINQQLASDQIINVVSAAKIQELPDANAAESVGRLPGVSVLRSGGEGNKVVIRGLAPKYNKITIDGMQMSSANASDRGTDLSMISSNMIEGIQVAKTVTADMDADVIGGSVNFDLREAKMKEPGKPNIDILIQGAYNNLSNAVNKFNNYKYVGSIEYRFFEEKFGVFTQFDMERKNLMSNEMGASYAQLNDNRIDYEILGINLNNVYRDRQRYNGALVLDYVLPEGKIKLTSFFSTGKQNTQNRSESFSIGTSNSHSYSLSSSIVTTKSINNSLNYQQQLSFINLDAKFSYSYSQNDSPEDWTVGFIQASSGLDKFVKVSNLNPEDVVKASNNIFSSTKLLSITAGGSFSKQNSYTGLLNLKTSINLSDMISAEIKAGGKYRYQYNYYNYDLYDGAGGGIENGGGRTITDLISSHFGLGITSTTIPITYFTDNNYDYGKFISGKYKMVAPLDYGKMLDMVNLMKNNVAYIAANKGEGGYAHDDLQSTTNDYSGNESVSAFYLMSIVNVGPQITIIPGIRYQGLRTEYNAPRGIQAIDSYKKYDHIDTTVIQTHNYWLPDLSVKYKPFDWCDLRLSYSSTLSYPDYTAIIPKINAAPSAIVYNNIYLSPARSTNYDAYVSVYNNSIGLFTVGAFLKHITDMVYVKEMRLKGAAATPYYPSIGKPITSSIYYITMYKNNSYEVNNFGIELDWQTHLWYLPGPLSGLVFSANYTHVFSKAEYPYVFVKTVNGRQPVYIDTSFTCPLLYQPDNIVNLSLGYDYAGFSARLSMLYQADIFTGADVWDQLRSHTAAYTRWDLAIKQELPWYGIQLFGDLNNINGVTDKSVISAGGVPRSEQDYGLLMDFGIRLKF